MAGTLTSCTLILLSAVLTTLGWYQKLAAKAGAGSLVPITGFANAVVSAAIEFKAEGRVLGTGAKMFLIAGPVIVYGTLAAVVYGGVLWLLGATALSTDTPAGRKLQLRQSGIACSTSAIICTNPNRKTALKGGNFSWQTPGRYPVVPHPACHRRTRVHRRQKGGRKPAGGRVR